MTKISRCTACGEEYPSAPPGVVHKCGKCSGGICQPVPESQRVWPLLGYAPGSYLCTCSDCKGQFEGDKRAHQCLSCAVICANTALAAAKPKRATNLRFFAGSITYTISGPVNHQNHISTWVGWYRSEEEARGDWVARVLKEHAGKGGGIASAICTDVTDHIESPA